jgi:hypothetical protein
MLDADEGELTWKIDWTDHARISKVWIELSRNRMSVGLTPPMTWTRKQQTKKYYWVWIKQHLDVWIERGIEASDVVATQRHASCTRLPHPHGRFDLAIDHGVERKPMVRRRRSNIPQSHTRWFCVTDTMNADEVADVIALSIVRGTVGVQGGRCRVLIPNGQTC